MILQPPATLARSGIASLDRAPVGTALQHHTDVPRVTLALDKVKPTRRQTVCSASLIRGMGVL